jgi:hypothetical protein
VQIAEAELVVIGISIIAAGKACEPIILTGFRPYGALIALIALLPN